MLMVRIELLEMNEDYVRYKFFPEKSEICGIVSLNRKTGEKAIEKTVDGYGSNYAAHAIYRVSEYWEKGEFKEQDLIAWY